jgi:hypothetical protein
MDSISTLNQVMLLLRQQLAEKSQRQERVPLRRETSPPPSRSATQQDDAGHAKKTIRAQIDTLRLAGVTDERQLFRVAIEGMLLREFGDEVGNDPAFQQMGDWVCTCLEEKPETRSALRRLLEGMASS